MRDEGCSLSFHYIPSPNPQTRIQPTDEYNDENNDEIMMKLL